MRIIANARAGQYHHYARNEKVRSRASKFLVGHLPLDQEWSAFAQERVAELATPNRFKKACEPGNIGTLASPSEAALKRGCRSALTVFGLEEHARRMRDGQTVLCLGAVYHDDLHGWSDEIFLNWYLAGPPRDFVVVGVGRVTIRPGDVVLFDPSRAHGLLRLGERTIDAATWPTAVEEHSIFLSVDLALSRPLDQLFGIRRGEAEAFEKAGSNEADWSQLRVCEKTGRLRKAPK